MWKSRCSRSRVKYCTANDHLQPSVLSRFWNPVGAWIPYHLHKATDMPYSLISSESLDTEMKDGRYHRYWIQKSNDLNVSYSHLNQHEGCCFLTCCCCGAFFTIVAIVRLKINVLFSVRDEFQNKWERYQKQESIPVACVPPTWKPHVLQFQLPPPYVTWR